MHSHVFESPDVHRREVKGSPDVWYSYLNDVWVNHSGPLLEQVLELFPDHRKLKVLANCARTTRVDTTDVLLQCECRSMLCRMPRPLYSLSSIRVHRVPRYSSDRAEHSWDLVRYLNWTSIVAVQCHWTAEVKNSFHWKSTDLSTRSSSMPRCSPRRCHSLLLVVDCRSVVAMLEQIHSCDDEEIHRREDSRSKDCVDRSERIDRVPNCNVDEYWSSDVRNRDGDVYRRRPIVISIWNRSSSFEMLRRIDVVHECTSVRSYETDRNARYSNYSPKGKQDFSGRSSVGLTCLSCKRSNWLSRLRYCTWWSSRSSICCCCSLVTADGGGSFLVRLWSSCRRWVRRFSINFNETVARCDDLLPVAWEECRTDSMEHMIGDLSVSWEDDHLEQRNISRRCYITNATKIDQKKRGELFAIVRYQS